ncbi:DUF4105 domain-containing protein [Hahella sp. HN01]|uniref:Lnb N-terminal periplasmic domain-containing protein n=1 Tax=Hahella sp. HN01 TaxID=2847262 RepID=UPI001C1EF519|nr:DUF4105 domain-containing protein [Hahella sp. HN01]MBU6950301.1 DUF4105 domain-containing protein [Hahella sp. HN01]
MKNTFKGGLIASLFLASSVFAASVKEVVDLALEKELYQDPAWKSLIHFQDDNTKVHDQSFILSGSDFNPKNELVLTINYLLNSSGDSQAICRFPARYYWLGEKLSIDTANLENCFDLKEYISRAPIDDIDLVYSSENLSQPSSMMGHILLKISGKNEEGRIVEHGVSFFTEVKGVNVPKIMFDSLVVGKPGYFALTPYSDKLDQYLRREQRNVWEYRLDSTEFQRKLIQYHIWELKQTKLDYFFHDYNCATLTSFMVSFIDPSVLNMDGLWMTPLDVVKQAHQAGIIDHVSVLPSNRWKIRMLEESLPRSVADSVKKSVEHNEINDLPDSDNPEQDFLMLQLAGYYTDYLHETDLIDARSWRNLTDKVEQRKARQEEVYEIDISEYKNPVKTPKDSQLYSGLALIDDEAFIRVGFLPASHGIEDDNRQFFSENELKLGDLSFLVSPEDGKVKLDRFQLYSVSSLIPWDSFTGGLSGRLEVGLEQHYDEHIRRHSAANISGGLGMTFALDRDMSVYFLAMGGYGFGDGTSYLYLNPEAGMIINEVYDMKSIISYQTVWNQLDSGEAYHSFNLKQSKFIGDDYAIILDYERRWSSSYSSDGVEAVFKYYF